MLRRLSRLHRLLQVSMVAGQQLPFQQINVHPKHGQQASRHARHQWSHSLLPTPQLLLQQTSNGQTLVTWPAQLQQGTRTLIRMSRPAGRTAARRSWRQPSQPASSGLVSSGQHPLAWKLVGQLECIGVDMHSPSRLASSAD